MIIFTTKEDSIHSIPRQVTDAINGGCRWIEINMPSSSADEISKAISEIRPLCEQTESILTLRRDPEMVKKLDVGGVRIDKCTTFTSKLRYDIGGSSIIGIGVSTTDELQRMSRYDIDYLWIKPRLNFDETKRFISEAVECKAKENIELALVAEASTEAEIAELLKLGVNGIIVSDAIADSENPQTATEKILKTIQG